MSECVRCKELDQENGQLREAISVACNFHGEDLVPALIRESAALKAKVGRLEAPVSNDNLEAMVHFVADFVEGRRSRNETKAKISEIISARAADPGKEASNDKR